MGGYTPEHSALSMVRNPFILVRKKPHVSNGGKMYLLRSPALVADTPDGCGSKPKTTEVTQV